MPDPTAALHGVLKSETSASANNTLDSDSASVVATDWVACLIGGVFDGITPTYTVSQQAGTATIGSQVTPVSPGATTARVVGNDGGTYNFPVEFIYVPVTGDGTLTLRVTRSGGSCDHAWFVAFVRVQAPASIGAVGTIQDNVSSTTQTVTLDAAPATPSLVLMFCYNSNGAGATTHPAGTTELADANLAGFGVSFDAAEKEGSASTANQFTGLANIGTFGRGSIAVEIKTAAVAAVDEASPPQITATWSPGILLPSPLVYSGDAEVAATADQSTSGYLDANAVPYADITGDRTSSGYLPAPAVSYSTATHDATLAVYLPAGVDLRATVSHTATVAGLLPAGVDVRATVSHDTSIVGYLPAGVVAFNGVYLTGFATIGYLPIGVDLRSTVTADRTVTARLDAGIAPYATVTHAANIAGYLAAGVAPYSTVTHGATVVGLLELGSVAYAVLTASNDISTTGLLVAGVWPRAVVSHDATVSGLLTPAVDLRATVSRTASVAGYLAAGVAPVAPVSIVVSLAGRLYVGVFPAAGLGLGLQLVGVSVGNITTMTSSGLITSGTASGDDGITSGTSDGSIE